MWIQSQVLLLVNHLFWKQQIMTLTSLTFFTDLGKGYYLILLYNLQLWDQYITSLFPLLPISHKYAGSIEFINKRFSNPSPLFLFYAYYFSSDCQDSLPGWMQQAFSRSTYLHFGFLNYILHVTEGIILQIYKSDFITALLIPYNYSQNHRT